MSNNNVNIEHDFTKVLDGLEKMGIDLYKLIPNVTLKAAKIIRDAIVRNLPRSEEGVGKKLQWKKTSKYIHMQDDVKITSIKTDEETQDKVRHVRGGKYTHYKWKWWEFGTSKMKGNQFMTRSMKETQNTVQAIIDEGIKKVVK